MTKHFLIETIAQLYRMDAFDKMLFGYVLGYVAALEQARGIIDAAEKAGENPHIAHVSTMRICQKFITDHGLEDEMSVEWACSIITRTKELVRKNKGRIKGE